MSTSLYEIVELPNGEVVLQRAGSEGEPLVSLRFSKEALLFMREGKAQVTKAMIEAGMEAASELAKSQGASIEVDNNSNSSGENKPVLH